nr:MAG TPA: hypothetical protein [Caudoviricetes sp.]
MGLVQLIKYTSKKKLCFMRNIAFFVVREVR